MWQEREDARLLKKLDGCLARMGVTAAELADREHERQARACLWTANAIQSLRALSAADLRPTLEALSAVDAALRRDPAGVYPRMDAESRAMYRERAARLAERFGVAEAVVANRALECAQNRAHGDTPALSGHVGYYLMDAGAPALHRTLGSAPLSLRAARWLGAHAATLYVLGTMLGSLAATVLLCALGVRSWTVAPALLVAGEGFRQLSALCIHRLSPPRRMPRLAPDQVEGEVLVVVPALLSDRETALDMARRLSVLRLANPESRLSYMLLGDFQDGPAAVEPEDGGVTEAALSAVRALNEVWNGGFYYLHRQRAWNERAERAGVAQPRAAGRRIPRRAGGGQRRAGNPAGPVCNRDYAGCGHQPAAGLGAGAGGHAAASPQPADDGAGPAARLRGHSAAHGGVRRNRAHAHCQPVGRGRGL